MRIQELRTGAKILFHGDPWEVIHSDFMKKAQRRPVMRTKIRNLKTGAVMEQSFKQGDNVENVDLTIVTAQYLYGDAITHHFMQQENYEQLEIPAAILGDNAAYLKEGETVDVMMFDGKPIGVELPTKVDLKVVEAPPGVKGDTASNVTKDVKLENGLSVKAPLFINVGDVIRIDTRTGDYVERVQQ